MIYILNIFKTIFLWVLLHAPPPHKSGYIKLKIVSSSFHQEQFSIALIIL